MCTIFRTILRAATSQGVEQIPLSSQDPIPPTKAGACLKEDYLIHPQKELPAIPVTDGEVANPVSENEEDYSYVARTKSYKDFYYEKDICRILRMKEGSIYTRWMGTISLSGEEKKCVVITSVTARISLINEHIVCGTLDLHVRAFNMSHVPMSASEVNCHLLGILEGMALIHSYGFLHPGLSSNKILLTNQGVCKLYDFCLSDNARNILEYKMSRVSSTSCFRPITYIESFVSFLLAFHVFVKKTLSLNQFPPEAIQRNDYSQKSDVWSTAVVIWEILSNGKLNKFLTLV
ncbi:Muscle, skeletal receptor tyrosine-protein kinase [Holothuria leucospilota]|uniref:Muscle, skeletal receptor tyrosine-protein kinase n=1 Tax=Holothuria leucospilota TaxID=206669 RepID=A0A9Q0YGD8_HOLLE|nr:Muscle, skeletal receptor tyrosine-protein kinase [Holothuria leucospilota]